MDSPQKLLKDTDRQISSILRGFDVRSLDRTPRELLVQLRLHLDEAQRYGKDLAAAEFWNEREAAAKAIAERIELANKCVLELSSYDIFGPTDVAHIGAQLDTIKSKLE